MKLFTGAGDVIRSAVNFVMNDDRLRNTLIDKVDQIAFDSNH